jgi:hypothetical protein
VASQCSGCTNVPIFAVDTSKGTSINGYFPYRELGDHDMWLVDGCLARSGLGNHRDCSAIALDESIDVGKVTFT